MPTRRLVPFFVVLTLVVVLATAGMTRWSGGDDGGTDVDDPTAVTSDGTTTTLPSVRPPGVAAGRCGTVTFTPPTATEDHQADLCRPRDAARGAVVLVHGGGGYSGDRSTMREWAGWYRSEGFVTLSIDYTLLGDGSAEPVFPRPERDMKAAIQWTRLQAETLGIDPQAILVHGSSAGARLAAQAYVTAGDPYYVSRDVWPGVADDVAGFVGFYGYYDGDTLEAARYYGGLPDDPDRRVRQRWSQADSVSHATEATGPALLFHGDIDGLINMAQTERFGAALVEAGVDVTAFIVTDGDHAFDGRFGDLTTETGQDAADEVRAWLDARFPA